MAQYDQSGDLEEVKARTDIVDLISQYVPLKRAGATFKACCPFHKEKTPSFTVNPQKQIYHCFGCGAGGDVFSFIMQHEGMDFRTALEMLAERAGVSLQFQRDDRRSTEKKELYQLHAALGTFFRRCLNEMKSAEKARKYLQDRLLDGEIAEQFGIGYAPQRWDTMQRWAERNNYTLQQLESAGLIVKNEREQARHPYYDRFRNRVMFPIHDEQGRTIGFSGRTLEDKDTTAKYVNSPETVLFHKSRILYALDRARKAIVDSSEALICEGQIDVIRCHQKGFRNAVAAQGTAFTEAHARMIKRYADSVTLIFDSDAAGRKAAVRAAHVFLETGLAVRIASLPPGSDPDSFLIKEGAEAFKKKIESAVSIIEFQVVLQADEEDIASELGAMRTARIIGETIAYSPNPVQRTRMLQEAARLLNVPQSAIEAQLTNRNSRQRRTPAGGPGHHKQSSTAEQAPPADELALCEYMLRLDDYPELTNEIDAGLSFAIVSHPLCRAIVSAARLAQQIKKPVQEILRKSAEADEAEDKTAQLAAALQMAPEKIAAGDMTPQDAFRAILLRLWQKALKRRREEMIAAGRAKNAQEIRRLTLDIKALHNWEDGELIIAVYKDELEEQK